MSSSGAKSSKDRETSTKDKGSERDIAKDARKSGDKGAKGKEKGEDKPKPKNAAELREWEEEKFHTRQLSFHGGYLKPIILSLSKSLGLPIPTVSMILGLLYFSLHLITPPFLLPHLSALVTLVVPVQATLLSIETELNDKKGQNKAKNSAQWCLFWGVFAFLQFARGWVAIWRPGWKVVFEITRTGLLITVGGPWFGRSGLYPPGPSDELRKMERAEEAKRKESEAKKEKEMLKAEKKKKVDKTKEEKKLKEAKKSKAGK